MHLNLFWHFGRVHRSSNLACIFRCLLRSIIDSVPSSAKSNMRAHEETNWHRRGGHYWWHKGNLRTSILIGNKVLSTPRHQGFVNTRAEIKILRLSALCPHKFLSINTCVLRVSHIKDIQYTYNYVLTKPNPIFAWSWVNWKKLHSSDVRFITVEMLPF